VVGDPDGHLNFMPVESAARQMARIARRAPVGFGAYHVVHHDEVPATTVFDVLRTLGPVRLTMVAEPPSDPNPFERSARAARSFVLYLRHRRRFDNSTTQALLGAPDCTQIVDLDYLLTGIGKGRADLLHDDDLHDDSAVSVRRSPQPRPIPTLAVPPATATIRGLTFVVTAGRSGSTALSSILNAHPDVLSLNELFSAVRTTLPLGEVVSARRFWRTLADPHPVFDAMQRGGSGMPEFLYPGLPGSRFDAETTGIPAISMMTLPHLTEDPDAVFDQLGAVLAGRPDATVADHFRHLFSWLATRFGGIVAVERSGMSTATVPWLRRCFPEARFVHLYRDGADSAVSMSGHTGFRLMMLIQDGLDLLYPGEIDRPQGWQLDPTGLPMELAPFLGDRYDRDRLMGMDLPVARFAAMWSAMVQAGCDALADLPPDRHLPLSYTDLVTEPPRRLRELATFLDITPHHDWLARGAATLDPSRSGAASRLPGDQLRQVMECCAPGEARLQRERARHSATPA
jgi:hypothetical protein